MEERDDDVDVKKRKLGYWNTSTIVDTLIQIWIFNFYCGYGCDTGQTLMLCELYIGILTLPKNP